MIRKLLVLVNNVISELPVGDTVDLPPSTSATSLQVDRIADVQIYAGDCVKSNSPTHVGLATNNGDYKAATVLGIAVNDAGVGETVTVVIMGVMNNAIFSVFTLNDPLFLDLAGGITDVRPVNPPNLFLTLVGKSLGGTAIFIQIGNPTQLA